MLFNDVLCSGDKVLKISQTVFSGSQKNESIFIFIYLSGKRHIPRLALFLSSPCLALSM